MVFASMCDARTFTKNATRRQQQLAQVWPANGDENQGRDRWSECVVRFGARKDFTELIIKNGDDKLHIYVCPKPFQEEMGISFTKGDQVAVTGSKVKQDASDVILARELVVKGTDHASVPWRQRQPSVGLANWKVTA
jgi:hypothetical protein